MAHANYENTWTCLWKYYLLVYKLFKGRVIYEPSAFTDLKNIWNFPRYNTPRDSIAAVYFFIIY